MKPIQIKPSSLKDPLYYLRNARQVIDLCLENYSHLLFDEDHIALQRLLSLDETIQALLIRMIMRKGNLFRSDQLQYTEIPHLEHSLEQLSLNGLIEINPRLTLEHLAQVCRKDECFELLQSQGLLVKKSLTKSTLIEELKQHSDQNSLCSPSQWWSKIPFNLIQLNCERLFDRLRLLFFGNLHQDWSAFILTELGLQRYEPIQLNPETKPFTERDEILAYQMLFQIEQQLDTCEEPEQLYRQLPDAIDCDWIEYRRQKCLFRIGQRAERIGHYSLALSYYQQSQHEEAKLRYCRLLEKQDRSLLTFEQAHAIYAQLSKPVLRLSMTPLLNRTAKREGIAVHKPQQPPLPSETIFIPEATHSRIEYAVIDHLTTEERKLFYVENRLFTGLFGLLFWSVMFAPVRGAFFNPFQSGPADLYRPQFREKRMDLIESIFSALETDHYQDIILKNYQDKYAINNSLIHWPSLSRDLIHQALHKIPAKDLKVIFQYLLLDIRQHRKGLPDLILFDQNKNSYQLLEVKGPSDRLQDHQRLWMEEMIAHEIPVTLLNVNWVKT